MKFEDYIEYNCNLSDLSKYADEKRIIPAYFGQLKGSYRKYLESATEIELAKFGIRMYRAKKEMFCAAQMLEEAKTSKVSGCVIGYFFLCYYALFHSMQANLFLNMNITDEAITELSHSKVEAYFQDFYCKGKKSIMPNGIIEMFQQLKEFREVYSYVMPLNSPSNIVVNTDDLEYYMRLCFQLLNMKTFMIHQIKKSTHVEASDWNILENFFAMCCYRKNPVTGEILKDEADKDYLYEVRKYSGIDFMPFYVELEHDFDQYGVYDSNILEQMGFKGSDTIKAEAFRFIYNSIV